MRFKQFKPTNLTEQQLDELRMNPTTLQQFATSDDAKGIVAGFEAELVFTGLGGEPDYDQDPEPDYDADERCNNIDQVIDFFSNDEFGYATYGRDLDNLREGMDEKYFEWQDEQMMDAFRDEQEDLIRKVWVDERSMEERIHDFLVEGMDLDDKEADRIQAVGEAAPTFRMSSEQQAYANENPDYQIYLDAVEGAEEILQEDVEESIRKQDGYYDSAIDDFRDNFYVDDDSSFFSDVGWRWMSDIAEEFSLMWPVMTYTGASSEGGFNEESAERLADDLHEKLGVKTKVSSGYHSAKRDNETWIFEPDSSLDADDSDNMPVEIVSPPMPLEECLRQMENFFTWAEDNGAYANSSTGFHMGVSLPFKGGNVDYVKLALFLGDEHVLREFGRSGNHFCEAAIKKIKSRVRNNKEAIGNAIDLMRHNLIELAQKALEINNHGFGKYTSINPQGGNDSSRPDKERGAKYIEFRSAGGTNYFEDIDKLKNTLLRYAQAMHIASRPDLERKEYYKKLYKLIAPAEGDPDLDLFARFATGAISAEELKKTWADKQLGNEPKGYWKLWDANGKAVAGQEYNNYTKSDAWQRAWKEVSPGSSLEGFQRAYKLLPKDSATGDWEVYNVNTGETLETLHGFENRGAAADSVYDKYEKQGIGINLRPADPEQPEKPLTKRERLAKNIKSAPPEEIKNWKVYDTQTGEVHYEQEGRKSNLVQAMRKMEIDNKWPRGRLAITLADKQPETLDDIHKELGVGKQSNDANGNYVLRRRGNNEGTGPVLHQFYADSNADAVEKARQWTTERGMERLSVWLDTAANTPAEAFNSISWRDQLQTHVQQAQQQPSTVDHSQQRGEQEVDGTGEPIWEIYDVNSGRVVQAFTAADEREAAEHLRDQLADWGTDDDVRELYAVRPKMATNESILSKWESIVESMIAPVRKLGR